MFPTLIRRMADSAARKHVTKELPNHVVGNPYQARKVWPPDFAALNPQQQLRFEKKYKRRMRHAAYSPRWDKGIKYAQLVTITAALIWIFFYAEFEWWGRKYKPYDEMRKHAKNILGVELGDKTSAAFKQEPELPPATKESGSK